jgi:CheY-like chemotaxis protein
VTSDHGTPKRTRTLRCILVVDDEPGIVEFLRYVLEDHGYRVHTSGDGQEALRVIDRERPSLVLTDLMMPRLNGWELCKRLRSDPTTHDIPIVGMSAVDPKGAPVDAFLAKPFELDDLFLTLHKLGLRPPKASHSQSSLAMGKGSS